MLYKVTVGRDVYLGTPEEIVAFMAKADGAPASPEGAPASPEGAPASPEGAQAGPEGAGGRAAYMEGVAARLRTHGKRVEVDVTDARAFLESLAAARLLRLERRKVPKDDPVDPRPLLEGPLAFGADVDEAALRRDLFDED